MTIAVVQTVGVSGGPVSSVTTGSITTATGNLVISNPAWRSTQNSTSIALSGVSDNGSGNSWTQGIAPAANSLDGTAPFQITLSLAEYYNENINGKSGHTFTATAAASTYIALAITEVSGQAVSALDKTSTKTDDVGHNVTHTGTATATRSQAGELLHGTIANNIFNAFHTYTPPSPWTAGVNIPDVSGCGICTGDQVVSSTGTDAFACADAGSVDDKFVITTSTWKAAAGGGGTTTLTAVKGDLTLAGKTVLISQGQQFTLVKGDLSLTGYGAALVNALAGVKGDLSLSGKTLSFSQGQQFTLAKGDLTLAGKTDSLVNSLTLVKGNLTLTGQTILFNVGVNFTLVKGDLTLSGKSAKLTNVVTLQKGSLALTGYASSIPADQSLTLVAGALGLQGQIISFTNAGLWTPATPITGIWVDQSSPPTTWTPQ